MKDSIYNMNIIILAIETSCDDTSIAIIKNGKVLINCAATSEKLQKKYGGIVPEIASRSHCEEIDNVLKTALLNANINIKDINYIAYTSNPGLIGSLHVGKVFALQLASLLNVPVLPINHMIGHVYSYFIDHDGKPNYPFLALIASGGHTFIALFESINKYTILNETTDDAVGEALDKIGRNLGMEYPGGISIDKKYDPNLANLKIISHSPPENDFSFSGIKTAVLNFINNHQVKNEEYDKIQLASSALKWIIDDLMIKLKYWINQYNNIKAIVLGGGVSANSLLRSEVMKINGILILIPSLKYTGDNAAMIGIYAYHKIIERSK